MAVMANFARMPTQRKVLVFIVIGVVMGLLYFQFVFKSLKSDTELADGDHDAKLAQNKSLEAEIPKFEALKARLTQLKKTIDENQKALPTEAELPAFFETLNRKVLESGVEVNAWRQDVEVPVETFVKVPVRIELTGTFVEIKKFFASLVAKKKKPGATQDDQEVAERERIVSIENLSLENPVVKDRRIVLTAKFTATTYRQEDKKEVPVSGTTKPGEAGAGSGSGARPPAATPKGAKVRVEDALDKSETRTKNADKNTQDKPAGSGARLKGGL